MSGISKVMIAIIIMFIVIMMIIAYTYSGESCAEKGGELITNTSVGFTIINGTTVPITITNTHCNM